MHLPTLLRVARRRRGLSIRAAAYRCDVPRSTWADWETGAAHPTTARLEQVLRALELDLSLVERAGAEPPGQRAVERHLRRSLTQRARLALGDQLSSVVAACREQPRLLTGPAAVGVWVPYAVARGPLPLPVARAMTANVRLRLTPEYARPGPAWAEVPTPDELLASGLGEQWPMLAISSRLLAERGRDAVGRRLPPHRDPDEQREAHDLAQTLTWGARGRLPVSDSDSRAWRLDAPPTLDAALARPGLPPRNESRRGGSAA